MTIISCMTSLERAYAIGSLNGLWFDEALMQIPNCAMLDSDGLTDWLYAMMGL